MHGSVGAGPQGGGDACGCGKFGIVALAIIHGQAKRGKALGSGNGKRGGGVESTRKQNDGGLHGAMLADEIGLSAGAVAVYNADMPLDPISAAIVSSIVGSVIQEVANAPGPYAPVPIEGVPRILPEDTIRADMQFYSPTSVAVNGQLRMLAPGVQIRDPFNTVVLPGQISALVPVRYQTDVSGAIAKIWILSQREAAQP